MLEYCWLFALLLRSARYFPGAEGKWIPLPPMLPPSSPEFLYSILNFTYCILHLVIHDFYVRFILAIFLLKFSVNSLIILITSVLNSVSSRLLVHFIQFFHCRFLLFFHLKHVSLSPQFVSFSVFVSVY